MTNKSKTTGIILLVFSIGLVPTAFIINEMFYDQVYAGVPEALLGIQDEALPSLEDQIPGLATPDVLLGVQAEAVSTLESQIPGLATPEVLRSLKDESIAQLPLIINGSGAAQAINQTIDGVAFYVGYPTAKDQFFNSPTFQATYGYVTPQGVSDYYDTLMGDFDVVNLGYTATAQNNLLYGIGPLPGLITDLEMGEGLLTYMALYFNASLGDMALNATMQYYYNATWDQLGALAGYISMYLWDVVVKSQYSPPYTIEQYAEILFYAQWANGTLIEDGIDLSLFKEGVPTDTYGLEAGIPISTDITVPVCINLWDDSSPLSFANDNGIMPWIGAMLGNTTLQTLLISSFSLTPTQLSLVLAWLGNFISTLTPLLIYVETGYTIPAIAQLSFYEQWANGTIMGESILPEGFLSQLDASFAGIPYFEVGIPIPTGLSLTATMGLWNTLNEYSFVNIDGIMVWAGAATNTTLQTLLETTFGLTYAQLLATLTWLGSFISVRVPQLLEYETGYTIPELAQRAFYEQWANGTINGEAVLPDGFLAELDPPILGPPFFELGLTSGPSGLTVTQCALLWNENLVYSLVNSTGIQKWYDAESDPEIYTSLKLNNGGITDMQMTRILSWLPKFRDSIVNMLAKESVGLPMEPYALGNLIVITMSSIAGALALIGVILLIRSRRF
ncbi:MAG: hypothetical protein ACFE9R_14445 [Candidatus Hermodarchaeota archaeon]